MKHRVVKRNGRSRRKDRADTLLVARGLVESKSLARAVILAGQVYSLGKRVEKPGQDVLVDAPLTIIHGPRYVGRGGDKLEGALVDFQLNVEGLVALDVGSSTGGFTDCLLQHGTTHVYAVDAGRGQLASRLREDPRVTVMERVNARYAYQLDRVVDFVTFDVSFISLKLVMPIALRHVKDGGLLLALVKPQFEVGRRFVGKGGIVREPEIRAEAVGSFCRWVIQNGLHLLGIRRSVIRGETGNQEYFVLVQKL